jgi:hypothetical protein
VYTANITRANLLRPFPEFGDVSMTDNSGYSWYHALQTRIERRLQAGFTFQLAYTFSRFMDATSFLNPSDPMPYEVISANDRPHRLAMSGVWELPVGRGRPFGAHMPRALEFVAGGWQLGGVAIRQAGAPLGFGNAIFNGDLHDIPLPKSERSPTRWFNTDAGFNRVAAQQLASNIIALPPRFSGIRMDGESRFDFSLIKNFRMFENVVTQFRAEVYNAFNHPSFAAPNTSPTNTNFGRITATTVIPRQWQFSLRVKF